MYVAYIQRKSLEIETSSLKSDILSATFRTGRITYKMKTASSTDRCAFDVFAFVADRVLFSIYATLANGSAFRKAVAAADCRSDVYFIFFLNGTGNSLMKFLNERIENRAL